MKKFVKENKSIFILSFVLVLWSVLLTGCSVQSENDKTDDTSMVKNESVENNQMEEKVQDEMEKVVETEMAELDTEMKLWYVDYNSMSVEKSLSEGMDVVLFFHASRCPPCRRLDKNLTAEIANVPDNVQIFKLNYDNEKELKKKYGVTSQHTLVVLNKDGSLKNKIVGGNGLDDVLNLLK